MQSLGDAIGCAGPQLRKPTKEPHFHTLWPARQHWHVRFQTLPRHHDRWRSNERKHVAGGGIARLDEAGADAIVKRPVEAGINFIDTADV